MKHSLDIRPRVWPTMAAFVFATILGAGPLAAAPKSTTSIKVPAGSTVQMLDNGRFALRGRLGIGGTFSCTCSTGRGSCSTVQTEGVLECGKSGDSCTGTCDMKTTTSGGKAIRQ